MFHEIEKKDIAVALLSISLISLNVVVSKLGVSHFPPFMFATLRFLICIPLLFFIPKRKAPMKNLIYISFCWGVIYLGGINFALSSGISAGVTILITQLSAFITIALSAVFMRDIPKFNQMIGMLIGFLGICLICSVNGFTANVVGTLALLTSAFSFAIGAILVKKSNSDPLSLNVWISVISAFPMLFISYAFEDNLLEVLSSATFSQWGTVLYAGLGSMFLGGVGWAYVVKKYTLSSVAPFRLLTPVFGIIFAVVILRESYPVIAWVGASLVLAGLIITQLKYSLPAFLSIRKNP